MSGSNGISGTNGTNGSAGTNGLNSLVDTAQEPAGATCANGGEKVTSGLDANADGVLQSPEVTATSYICNGAPGAGINWVDVTNTAVQAQANFGYLADNAAQVSITLPASPIVGDLVQVSGIGVGGWNVVQNAGQSIATGNLQGGAIGRAWTARGSLQQWFSVASSQDGARLVAVTYGDHIYTSTDAGVTWAAQDTIRNWDAVASSADGTRLITAERFGQLYSSTDSGASWTARDSNRVWDSVASSVDGTRLVAAAYNDQIYTSTDSGVTWAPRDASRLWISVASSTDGTRLVAAVNNGQLYTSIDSGVTWTARDAVRNWNSVASSADGAQLAAVQLGGRIYTSTPTPMPTTSTGAGGSIGGRQYDAIDLEYAGNGVFLIRSAAGVFNIQ